MSTESELARAALADLTPDATVGAFVGTRDEAEYITSYIWASKKDGYPDWQWTVTMVSLPDSDPTVLELELLPTESSVIAPEWVPWSVRLAEYRAAQKAAAEAGEVQLEDEPVIVADDEIDADELDELDVDELDETDDDADEDDSDDDDESDDDESDDDADEMTEEEQLDEFGAADDDDLHGITLPGEEDESDDESDDE